VLTLSECIGSASPTCGARWRTPTLSR
jgi:hypothetical protein